MSRDATATGGPRRRAPTLSGRFSITAKLTMALLLVSLVPMIVVAWFNLRGSTEAVSTAEQENMKLVAGSLAGRLDQLIGGARGAVHFLSLDPQVAAFLGSDPELAAQNRDHVADLLSRVVAGSANIASAYLMDREGKFAASTNPKVIGKDYGYRDYFQVPMRGEEFASDLLVGTTSGESGVYLSGPVRDGKGALLGVAVVKMRGEAVSEILADVNQAGGSATAFLVNPESIIIYHPHEALVYRSLDTLSPQVREEIQSRRRFPVESIESLNRPLVKAAMIGSTQPGYVRHLASAQEPFVLGYAPMANHYWVVGVEKSEKAFAEPLNRLFQQVLYSVVLVGTLVAAFALLLGRAMVRPIRALTEATRFLGEAKGDATGAAIGVPDEESGGFCLDTRYKQELIGIADRHRGDEIGALARTFNDMEERLQDYFTELTTVTAAKERIESEMKIAARIQQSFLPEPFSAGERRRAAQLYVVMEPAKEVGGDLYDYFFLDDDHLFFTVGDVSDKGIPAGLFMGVTMALLHNIATADRTPSRVMAELNHALSRKNDACQFVTMFCGILHLPSGTVHYSHAGHNPPYLVSPAKGTLRPLVPVIGTALGIFDQDTYQTEILQLEPGDRLFLYTDGVTEAMDIGQRLYGEERLEGCLRAVGEDDSPEKVVERVMADVKRYAAGAPQSDDITAMCIEFRRP